MSERWYSLILMVVSEHILLVCAASVELLRCLVMEDLGFHFSEDELDVMVPFDCRFVVFIDKNAFDQVVQNLQLLWGKLELGHLVSF